jgi:hypothetical protein
MIRTTGSTFGEIFACGRSMRRALMSRVSCRALVWSLAEQTGLAPPLVGFGSDLRLSYRRHMAFLMPELITSMNCRRS